MSIENSIDTVGSQTLDLPACSAVHQPTAPLRAPFVAYRTLIIEHTLCMCMYMKAEFLFVLRPSVLLNRI
jgi:hypothetical protein